MTELVTKADLATAISSVNQAIDAVKLSIDNAKLSLTIRLGGIMVGVAAFAVLRHFH
jgi:hypothetical protein